MHIDMTKSDDKRLCGVDKRCNKRLHTHLCCVGFKGVVSISMSMSMSSVSK